MKPGAHLAFESRNPQAREWESWTAAEVATAGLIEAWTTVEDFSDDIASCTNHYRFAATGEVLTSSVRLRFRSAAATTAALGAAGFAVEQMYGDWNRGPVGPSAPELVVVAVSSPPHG